MCANGYNLLPPYDCISNCGNLLPDPGEECDDGNFTPGDGCNNCKLENQRGDGEILRAEKCDDGNLNDTDGCNSDCLIENGWSCQGMIISSCLPICGDKILVHNETCDPPN